MHLLPATLQIDSKDCEQPKAQTVKTATQQHGPGVRVYDLSRMLYTAPGFFFGGGIGPAPHKYPMRFKEISPELNEVSMTPSDFARAIETAPSERVLIGFEFEVCVPLTQQNISIKGLSKDDLRKLILNASEDTNVTEENIDVLSKLIKLKRPVPSAFGIETLQELYERSREVAIAQARDMFDDLPEEDRQYELDYIKQYFPERMENEYKFAQLIVRRFDNSRLEYVMDNLGNGSNFELYALLGLASTSFADINPENFDIDFHSRRGNTDLK